MGLTEYQGVLTFMMILLKN